MNEHTWSFLQERYTKLDAKVSDLENRFFNTDGAKVKDELELAQHELGFLEHLMADLISEIEKE